MAYFVNETGFRTIAAHVLDSLPDEFRKRMENVVVVVEDYPSEEDAESAGVLREELLGLFHGISRFEQEWCGGASGQLPERIVLYKSNIEAICSTEEELVEEIRLTVLHEIGHYFGLSDEEIEKYEKG
ncbi:MAG: metallopeptidase family protein [Deltaproteobacteria bacterium]|nr:metallopeptidase family protein [Deltaproteobacteria bacterium]MCL4873579.1 metallopeptidase family protein [bacterium]